jgi:hypothetical protein
LKRSSLPAGHAKPSQIAAAQAENPEPGNVWRPKKDVLVYKADPETAKAYETEKRRAQQTHPTDSHVFTDAKAPGSTQSNPPQHSGMPRNNTPYPRPSPSLNEVSMSEGAVRGTSRRSRPAIQRARAKKQEILFYHEMYVTF